MLDPVTLIASLNQPRHRDLKGHRDQIKRLVTRLVDDHQQNLTIGATSSPQPHIAATWGMQTLWPAPIVRFDQVRPLDLATLFQGKGIGTLALHPQGPLMRLGHMAHELGIAEPTIGHHHRFRQRHTAVGKGGEAFIEPLLGEMEFVLAFAPRPLGTRAADSKVNRDDEFAIANDHE